MPKPAKWAARAIAIACVGVFVGHFSLTLLYMSGPNLAKAEYGGVAQKYMRPFFGQNWHLFSPNPGISSRKLAIRCQGEQGQWGEWIDPLEPMFTDFFENRIGGLGKVIFVYRGIADSLVEQAAQASKGCKAAFERAKAQPAVADRPSLSTPGGFDPALPDPALEPSLPEATSADLPPSIPEDLPECSHDTVIGAVIATPAFDVASRYARRVCDAWVEPTDGPLARYQFKLLEFFPLKYSERAAGSENRWSRVVELPWPVIEGVE